MHKYKYRDERAIRPTQLNSSAADSRRHWRLDINDATMNQNRNQRHSQEKCRYHRPQSTSVWPLSEMYMCTMYTKSNFDYNNNINNNTYFYYFNLNLLCLIVILFRIFFFVYFFITFVIVSCYCLKTVAYTVSWKNAEFSGSTISTWRKWNFSKHMAV